MTGSGGSQGSSGVTADAVRAVAALNGVQLEPGRAPGLAAVMRELQAGGPWEGERLGFRFENGEFEFVRPAHVFGQRPPDDGQASEAG
jgi:hypothetical protein